jgi:hypothetical protein
MEEPGKDFETHKICEGQVSEQKSIHESDRIGSVAADVSAWPVGGD